MASPAPRVESRSAAARRRPIPAAPAVVGLLIAVELAAILWHGQGRFSYTLDDPYIHLAVAEELARGGYGINAGAFAAPASSILWPLLLAPFAGLDRFDLAPLALNCGLALASAAALARIVEIDRNGRPEPSLGGGLAVLLILAGGAIPILFTGLEHVLQIWLTLLILLGTLTALRHAPPPWWLWPALAAAPLVRYESLTVTLPFALLLWRGGHRWPVALALAATGLAMGGFSLLLLRHGLPPLPSSVLSKSIFAGTGLPWGEAWIRHLAGQFRYGNGTLIAGVVAALLGAAMLCPRERPVLLALAVATAGQLAFGLTRTSFGRYEAHLVTADLAMLALALTPGLRGFARRHGAALALAAAALALAAFWPAALANLAKVPLAADNIASQQREMRRFATEFWDGPVAVNDIGWVSYRNDRFVLDLWGLGLEEARQARTAGQRGWGEPLLDRYDVALMMVYDGWLGAEVPPGWVSIGRLALTRRRVSTAEAEVGFYARSDRAAQALGLARRFANTLPAGAKFRFPD